MSKKKKLVIVAVIVILLLSFGGAGVYFHIQNNDILGGNVDLNTDYLTNQYPNNDGLNGEDSNNEYQNGEDANLVYLPQNPFDPDLPVSSENWPEYLPKHIPGSVTLRPAEFLAGWFYDDNGIPQHRLVFYQIDGVILNLVDVNRLDSWDESFHAEGVDARETMMLLHFIQYHDIQKEDFIAAVEEMRSNNEWRAGRGTDVSLEDYEIPNADIIFTFDPEIISYFYRRE